MATQSSVFKFCNILGNFRHVLNQRGPFPSPKYCTVRYKSLAEKAGIPLPPKRPLTPFFRFMKQIRSDISKNNPNTDNKEIIKIISQQWETADPKLKENFNEEYTREKEVYLENKDKYNKMLTEEHKEALLEARKKITQEREKKLYKKKCRELNKPFRAPTAFLLFIQSTLNERGPKNYQEWLIEQSKVWSTLTESQKQPFVNEADKLRQLYREKLSLWKEKMVQLGNIDLINGKSLIESRKSKSVGTKSVEQEVECTTFLESSPQINNTNDRNLNRNDDLTRDLKSKIKVVDNLEQVVKHIVKHEGEQIDDRDIAVKNTTKLEENFTSEKIQTRSGNVHQNNSKVISQENSHSQRNIDKLNDNKTDKDSSKNKSVFLTLKDLFKF